MPLMSIETNQELENDDILSSLSRSIATLLSKPESYLMLKYEHNSNMLFAGTNQPLAHIKIKSLGLDEEKTESFSKILCELMQQHFSISVDRIYIEFANPDRHMWGWNSSTF
ncbi:MAG: phenylpyruvate tautomerase MIF-related protein [Cocleimonas sp.]